MGCNPCVDSRYGLIPAVSSTKRPTGVDLYAGKRIYEADTGRELLYDGTGWVIMSEPMQTWTPQIDQGASVNIAKTVANAHYWRTNGWCNYSFHCDMTAGGSAGSAVTVTVPIASLAVSAMNMGYGLIYDATGTRYNVVAERSSSTTIAFGADGASSSLWGGAPNTALGVGDVLRIAGSYEMVSRYS